MTRPGIARAGARDLVGQVRNARRSVAIVVDRLSLAPRAPAESITYQCGNARGSPSACTELGRLSQLPSDRLGQTLVEHAENGYPPSTATQFAVTGSATSGTSSRKCAAHGGVLEIQVAAQNSTAPSALTSTDAALHGCDCTGLSYAATHNARSADGARWNTCRSTLDAAQ
jgi:hypothetical protein